MSNPHDEAGGISFIFPIRFELGMFLRFVYAPELTKEYI